MIFKTVVNIDGLKNAPSIFERQITNAAKKIEARLIGDAVKETPEDEGKARAGFKGTHSVSGFHALIEVKNNAPHFVFIEHGREPNKPAPPSHEGSALFNWVLRKINPDNPKAVTFLIARAIGERGLPAHAPMETSLEKNKQFIQNTLDKAVSDGVKKLNG